MDTLAATSNGSFLGACLSSLYWLVCFLAACCLYMHACSPQYRDGVICVTTLVHVCSACSSVSSVQLPDLCGQEESAVSCGLFFHAKHTMDQRSTAVS
jgi:hypothetical protein